MSTELPKSLEPPKIPDIKRPAVLGKALKFHQKYPGMKLSGFPKLVYRKKRFIELLEKGTMSILAIASHMKIDGQCYYDWRKSDLVFARCADRARGMGQNEALWKQLELLLSRENISVADAFNILKYRASFLHGVHETKVKIVCEYNGIGFTEIELTKVRKAIIDPLYSILSKHLTADLLAKIANEIENLQQPLDSVKLLQEHNDG